MSDDSLINSKKANEVLDDITYQAVRLEEAAKNLKELDLSKLETIKEDLEELKKLNIDTIENKWEFEMNRINQNISQLTKQLHLHELDEINLTLNQMQKKLKPFKIITSVMVGFSCFFLGWMISSFKPIIPYSKKDVIFIDIKKNPNIKASQQGRYNILFLTPNIRMKTIKSGETAILIPKSK